MKFGIRKQSAEGREQLNRECLRALAEKEICMYLRILEVDRIQQADMKETINVPQKSVNAFWKASFAAEISSNG